MFYNVHNRDLTAEEVSAVVSDINVHLEMAAEAPRSYFVVVSGDFNFSEEDFLILRAKTMAVKRSQRRRRSRAALWTQALARMLELEGEGPAHYRVGFTAWHVGEVPAVQSQGRVGNLQFQ